MPNKTTAVTEPEVDLEPARRILRAFREDLDPSTGGIETRLIPLLQEIQETYNYLPRTVLDLMVRETGIPASRVHGVITFYAQFSTTPRGRHTIRCCQGTACHVKGSERISERIREELKVEDGETTEDMRFTFENVACLGTCFLAPVMMVDGDYYGNLTSDRVPEILEKYT
ncbi:MAG: NADH-quinone oxidoreductase subunit NuoE [Spirochaetia bacterium]